MLKRVLLVEDDRACALVVSKWLAQSGYDVGVAGTVERAKRRFAEPWDLVISDVELPDGTGLELADVWKGRYPERPFGLITAHSNMDVTVEALRHRVDEVFLKLEPLRREAFMAKVGQLVTAPGITGRAARKVVLAVGAHPEDIEIGCGGALAHHVAAGDEVHMLVMRFSEDRALAQLKRSESENAAHYLGARFHVPADALHRLDVGHVQRSVRSLVTLLCPTTIYAHSKHDDDGDHRLVALGVEALAPAGVACLAYQSATSTPSFAPNHFVAVTHHLERKLDLLQIHAHPSLGHDQVNPEAIVTAARYWSRYNQELPSEPFMVVHPQDPTLPRA